MEKTWNINGLNDKLGKLVNFYLSNPTDKETMKEGFKKIFQENGVNDSKFKLFKVSTSGNLAEIEGENAETYALKYSERIFEVTNRDKVVTDEEKNAKDPNAKPKKYYTLNIAKIQPETSKFKMKSNMLEGLVEAGIDVYAPVTEATIKNLDTNIDLESIKGRPLIDGLVEIVEDLAKNKDNAKSQNPTLENQEVEDDARKLNDEPLVHESLHREQERDERIKNSFTESESKPITKEELERKKNLNKEESTIDMEQVGEGTGDINYFVGYDKEKVGRLFEGRPAVFSVFKEFVEKYNKLMNVLLSHELSPEDVKDLRKDIDPYFQKLSAACSGIGGDGSLIQNLCDGMLTILDETFNAEIEGREINGLKLKNSLQGNKAFDHTDNDGLRNDPVYSTSKPAASQTSTKAVSDLVGYDELVSPQNLEIMDITLGIDRDELLREPNPLELWIEELARANALGVLDSARALTRHD